MAFTLAASARSGVRAGLAAAAGVGFGALCWSALAAAGLAALLAASANALEVIRFIGALYLFYLAWTAFRDRHKPPDFAGGPASVLRSFRAGALTNLLNPKVGLFFLAFLPAFTDPAAGPVWLQSFVLGAIFSATGAAVLCLVAFGAGALRERIAGSAAFRARLNLGAAGVFAGLGAYLLVSRDQ